MKEQQTPPRLFVIFASQAHEAVIFRRGPSSWFHVIRWDTKNDRFYPGAWVKGRIYPERCDLSPNGELLLYFIHQGRKAGTGFTNAWTAISRSPWLSAIGLWPQGTTYGGGGRFIGNRNATLRHFPVDAHPDYPGAGLRIDFATRDASVPMYASTQEVDGAEWSGRDQRGRLVYCADGKLMCVKSDKAVCLADLSDCTLDPKPAPAGASKALRQT